MYWLVFLRVIIAFFILGTIFFIDPDADQINHYGLIGGNVLVTLLSAVFIERMGSRWAYRYFHAYWDFLFVTSLIYVTGGYYSLFSFMYVPTVIFTAILTNHPQTMFMTLLCSVAYCGILVAQLLRYVTPYDFTGLGVEPPTLNETSIKVLLNSLAFLVTGVLAGYLANQSRAADARVAYQQRELDALKTRNESIIESLPIGLLTCDNQDRVTFANAHAAAILDRQPHTIVGLPLTTLLPALVTLPPEFDALDLELTRGDGIPRTLSATASPLRDPGGQGIGRVVTLQDVSGVRELEKAAARTERQAAIGKLAAGIAHEIRNPLASVSGSIQLLRGELKLEPVQAHLMDIVTRETERLNKLITDFLIYARPNKREETVDDVSAVLREQLDVLANDPACQDHIRIECDLHPDLRARFDPNQIRQLFWNLLINAVQAMEAAPGVLTVRSLVSSAHAGMIEVRVTDTGPGIEPELLRTIFDPFFTTKEAGTGLGLTVAHGIADAHGGRLLVESKHGQGTTFTVLLPAA